MCHFGLGIYLNVILLRIILVYYWDNSSAELCKLGQEFAKAKDDIRFRPRPGFRFGVLHLVSMSNCYNCHKSDHMKRDFPILISQEKKNTQELSSSPNHDDPKKNYLYALQSRDLQESSHEVVIDILQAF